MARKLNKDDYQGYYGDPGSGRYSNAKGISLELASRLDKMPARFTKKDVSDDLNLQTRREAALLTDALNQLKKRGLIRWDPDSSSWENVSRS